jgi:hypothetical protein
MEGEHDDVEQTDDKDGATRRTAADWTDDDGYKKHQHRLYLEQGIQCSAKQAK